VLTAFLIFWLITAIGLWIVTLVVPGVNASSRDGLLKAALVLGLINAFIRPILWLLTLPLTVLTFGLFALVVNAFTLWLTAALVKDFKVDGFASAILAAIVMALLGLIAFIGWQWLMMGEVHWVTIQRGPGIMI
jgi:putative membrane protein